MNLRQSFVGRLLSTRGAPRSERIQPQAAGAGLYGIGANLAGVNVTPQTALALSSVFSAINVISRDVATLPRSVYQQLPGGGKDVARRKPQHRLVNSKPNEEANAVRFYQALMGHVLGWGNGYAEITRDDYTGEPTGLYLLHPSQTKPDYDKSGALYYQLSNGKKLKPENVIHVAGLGFDGLIGYSPVGYCRQTIALSVAVETFGSSWFGNGSRTSGWIKLLKKLSAEAKTNLRESIEHVHGNGPANANRIGFLEEGMEYVPTTIPPEDAQFLATRAFQVEEVARLYNLPPHKIGDYSKSHLANVEEANLDYLSTTLTGWLEVLEAELDAKLFTDRERETLFIEHDMTRLMRGNMTARVAFYTGLRNAGALNADEIRARENMNPIGEAGGGRKYLAPLAMTTLDRAGEPAAPTPKPSSPPHAPEPKAKEEAPPPVDPTEGADIE